MITGKTLLLSDGFYSDINVNPNEILLKFMTSKLEKDSLYRVILTGESLESTRPLKWNGYSYTVLKRIKEFRYSAFKYIAYFVNTFIYIYTLLFIVPKQVTQIKKLIQEEKVKKIWVVMTSPQVIFLIRKLLKRNKDLKIYSSVWDSPEEFSLLLSMPGLFRRKLLRDFSFVMNHSVKLGVASINMKKEYEIRFQKKCFILQGDVTGDFKKRKHPAFSNDNLIIGFAGWLYTPEVWNALFEALDLVGWKIKEKNVLIKIIGNSISFSPPSKCNIEYLGKRTVYEVIDLLSDSFINFVPYRFSAETRYGSSVSFPSKINTYLAAQKPIFTISPSYTTPFQFVNDFETGISCASLDPADILNCLNAFIEDEGRYNTMIRNCEKVYSNNFHPSVFAKIFKEFID